MNDDRILTLHPKGKKGVNILETKYDTIRNFIIKTIEIYGQISYSKLSDLAVEELTDFDGKVVWYIVSVKLDLEARKIIKRVPKTSPHELVLY
ncbi:MAG: hypothetical protein AB8G11_07130 [Saprospiraceae bacterium]